MDWLAITALGACGGAVVQVIDLAVCARDWRKARHEALLGRKTPLPKLAAYVDVPADSLVFLTRLALGAIAGFIFHAQVAGATAAVAVGASAPALLRQLGGLRADEQSGDGTVLQTVTSKGQADMGSAPAEEG